LERQLNVSLKDKEEEDTWHDDDWDEDEKTTNNGYISKVQSLMKKHNDIDQSNTLPRTQNPNISSISITSTDTNKNHENIKTDTSDKKDLGQEFDIKIHTNFSEPDYFADMMSAFDESKAVKTTLIEQPKLLSNKFQATNDVVEVSSILNLVLISFTIL